MLRYPNIDPIALTLGPLHIHWYGVMYLLGFAAAWWLARRRAAQPGSSWSAADVDDFLFYAMLGVILGGRVGYVLFYGMPLWRGDWLYPLKIWEGGMSFHGGMLGVLTAAWIFGRQRQRHAFDVYDFAAPLPGVGLFFGRLGNFINGELWGRVTHVPWGMVFCNPRLAEENGGLCPAGTEPRHPSQLYEAALEGVLLFLVLRWATHRAHWLQRPGAVTGLWLVGYGAIRIGLENVRNPDLGMPDFPLGLTMGMILSIPMILVGVWLIWRAFRQAPAQPQGA